MEAVAAAPGRQGAAEVPLVLSQLQPAVLPTGEPSLLQLHLDCDSGGAAQALQHAAPASALEVTLVLQGQQLLAQHTLPLLPLLSARPGSAPGALVASVPVPAMPQPGQLLVLVSLLIAQQQVAAQPEELHVGHATVLLLPQAAVQELLALQQRMQQEMVQQQQQQQQQQQWEQAAALVWRQHLQPLLADIGCLLAGPAAEGEPLQALVGCQHPLQVRERRIHTSVAVAAVVCCCCCKRSRPCCPLLLPAGRPAAGQLPGPAGPAEHSGRAAGLRAGVGCCCCSSWRRGWAGGSSSSRGAASTSSAASSTGASPC